MVRSDHFLCMACHRSCKVGEQADCAPPIRYSDCCRAHVGLDPEGTLRTLHRLGNLQRENESLRARLIRNYSEIRAEVDRRGRLIEEQERDLNRLRDEIRCHEMRVIRRDVD